MTLVPASLVVCVVLAAAHADETAAGPVDRWFRVAVVLPLLPSRTDAFMVDYLGEPVGALLVTIGVAACCLLLRRGRLGVVAVAGPVVTVVVTTVAKPVVDRQIHEGHLSYPSGHTALLAAVAFVVGLLLVDELRRGAVVSCLLIVGCCLVAGGRMAFAQVTLDAHYPSDTLGGFCVAVVVIPVTALAVDRLAEVWVRSSRPVSAVAGSGE